VLPSIGQRYHELRIQDEDVTWRIVYRIDVDTIVITDVFKKKTQATSKHVIEACQQRLREYDKLGRG
jgi:phage-related protein